MSTWCSSDSPTDAWYPTGFVDIAIGSAIVEIQGQWASRAINEAFKLDSVSAHVGRRSRASGVGASLEAAGTDAADCGVTPPLLSVDSWTKVMRVA
jgi:hypothetical protein